MTIETSVDEIVASLKSDGFAVVEGVLSHQEVSAIRADLTKILSSLPTGRNDFEGFSTRRIYALFAKTRLFDAPATHPLVLGVLDRVLGPSYQLSAAKGSACSPNSLALR